jgi:hypothetical protein
MDKPEKLATQGTQGVEIQSKNTTEYVLNTTIRQQTQTTQIRHGPSHKQDMVPPTNKTWSLPQTRHGPSHKQDMVPPTNNCNQRRTEHRVHEEIETDITTRISERKDT